MSSDATKVVLVSGHAFGRRALEGIVSSAAAVVGSVECVLVAGLAETPSRVGAASFSDIADGHGIPFLAVTDPTLEAHVPVLAQYGPHYLLVIGWSRLIGPNALDLPRTLHGEPGAERNSPRHGCIGMHPTRLPEGRGQAPSRGPSSKACGRAR